MRGPATSAVKQLHSFILPLACFSVLMSQCGQKSSAGVRRSPILLVHLVEQKETRPSTRFFPILQASIVHEKWLRIAAVCYYFYIRDVFFAAMRPFNPVSTRRRRTMRAEVLMLEFVRACETH